VSEALGSAGAGVPGADVAWVRHGCRVRAGWMLRGCAVPGAGESGRQPLPGSFLRMFSGGCCCGGAGGTVRTQSFSGVRIVCLRSGFCRFPGWKEDFSRKIVIFASGASVYGSSERKR